MRPAKASRYWTQQGCRVGLLLCRFITPEGRPHTLARDIEQDVEPHITLMRMMQHIARNRRAGGEKSDLLLGVCIDADFGGGDAQLRPQQA